MSLEAAILGFLSDRPRSGYDLKTRGFDISLKDLWTADQAQIYRTLERLQTARLVTSKRKRQSGKPDRRIYDVTPAGRAFLSGWLAETTPLPPARDALLLRMYFSAELPDEHLVASLSARREFHQDRLNHLRSQLLAPQTAEVAADPRAEGLREMAVDGAIASERAAIDWLDNCIEIIKRGKLPAAIEADGGAALFGRGIG
ncbi:MAG: PadR family transcriptional regulator [Coriobacteriia bacterium]|nr:PadR family transcriptional regulator [Coriobacteriia bacterium]